MSSATIISTFQQSLKISSNHVLFEQDELNLSALEFDKLSSCCAFHLNAIGVRPQENICVLLARGIQASVAIYGILKSAACYVPIDMHSPIKRQRFIVNDSNCRCVIGQGSCPEWVSQLEVNYIDIDTVFNSDQISSLNKDIDTHQNAAILYTSGSTGTPKGVVISHRAIMSFVNWTRQTFSIDFNDRIANLTPLHFDLSLFDLFTGPISGATTVFIPEKLKLAPAKLTDWLIDKKITTWYTVPSILGFILFKGGLSTKKPVELRQILFAGEVFTTVKLKQLTDLLENTRFYNLFGPTETNVCLYWQVQNHTLNTNKAIPIGQAACGATLKISDVNQELLVKGPCLMNGYWKKAKVSLPLDDQGWFHTGDIVSLNDQGEYEYHGRLDRMIKSAGYRIEPEEIEMALNTIDGVLGAAVIGQPDPLSGTKIIAALAGSMIDLKEIRKQIVQRLPGYMQPSHYVLIEKIPVLSNGKTDYHTIEAVINNRDNR